MTIKAMIEARRKELAANHTRHQANAAEYEAANDAYEKAAAAMNTASRNALPEIVELVEFARAIVKLDDVAKFLDVEETFGVKLDRIREICDE